MFRLISILLFLVFSLQSQSLQNNKNEFGIILINDALFLCDKDYTGSIGASYRFKNIPLKLRYQIDTYTPCKNHFHLTEPKEGTHPYAGFGYLGAEYKILHNNLMTILNIKLGSTGKYSYAENFQYVVHTILQNNIFQGWDSQIQTKFGYALNPKIEYVLHSNYFTLLPYIDVEFGNIISIQKLGFKILSGINYNKDFLFKRESSKYNLDMYLSYDISNVSKNVFLTGFDDYEYGTEIISPVREIIIGLNWQFKQYGITCQNHIKSKEYLSQNGPSKYTTLIFYYLF